MDNTPAYLRIIVGGGERVTGSRELNSVIAMMEALERPDVEARFVFWFDN